MQRYLLHFIFFYRCIRPDNSELRELFKSLYQAVLGEIFSIQGKTSILPANPNLKEIVTENKYMYLLKQEDFY